MASRPLTVVQMLPGLESGGVERGTLEMGKYLAAKGCRSLVISSGGRMTRQLVREGSTHLQWRAGEKTPRCLASFFPLRRLLRDQKVDILHLRSRMPAWLGYLVWKSLPPERRPGLVTTFHGFYSVNRYSAIMARGEKVIAVSKAIANHIQTRYGVPEERIALIHRGFDETQFDPRSVEPSRIDRLKRQWLTNHDAGPVLMLPARFTRLKGHKMFLESLARIHHLPWIAICIGDVRENPSLITNLQKSAHNMGLINGDPNRGRIRFPGHCDDMPAALMLADVVLSTSIKPEACSRTLLEAQAMGKPVIASAHGGSPETVRDHQTGRLFAPGHAGQLAEVLEQVIGDPQLREQWGRNARAWVRHRFTISRLCRQTMTVYQTLAERGVRKPAE